MKICESEFLDMIETLGAGDFIEYTGELLTMRDSAQRRIEECLLTGKRMDLDLKDKIIFYAGPAKKPKNMISGSIGPTTSMRMDRYLEMLFKLGVVATVGKGKRTDVVRDLCRKYRRVYFVTPSGASAYLATKIEHIEVIAFHDLGPEAVHRLYVRNFPLLVYIDSHGETLNLV